MKKKLILLITIILTLTSCAYPEYIQDEPNNYTPNEAVLTAHFLDVGEADCNIIELPNGELMLIDSGEKKNAQDIINYINTLGYKKIDYVIATHPHTDHIGGLSEVINAFDIGYIYMPKVAATSKTYENLLETIANKGLSIKSGKAGVEVLNTDALKIEMLAPNKEKYSSYNNYSIVLKITYGATTFLYTGDAESLSESEITGDIKSDVLKVGHHGSDTSSSEEFLSRVNPKYAIISVGENNSYNHPSTTVLDRLKKYTDNIYRTDLNGTIKVSSDGVNITVEKER